MACGLWPHRGGALWAPASDHKKIWGFSLLPHFSLCENFSQIGKEMAEIDFYHTCHKLPQFLPQITTNTTPTTPTMPVTHTTPDTL